MNQSRLAKGPTESVLSVRRACGGPTAPPAEREEESLR
jgi:hypothetical protein